MTDATTQIRFTGDKDDQDRWIANKTGPTADTSVTLHFTSLSDAVALAEAEGWAGGVSLSGATYEAMLDSGPPTPKGHWTATSPAPTTEQELRGPGKLSTG
jgi:hypothetical protein